VTQQRPRPAGDSPGARQAGVERVIARAAVILLRCGAASEGPWGYLRASGAIVAPDLTGVAHCLHDPDAAFIAHARADVPWLVDQLHLEHVAHEEVERRLRVLGAAVRRANEALDRLPWQGDGLRHLLAEGVASAEVVAAIHAAASALDPETLGRRTAIYDRHEGDRAWAGPPAARAASVARPFHHAASGEGVVARLT
jgi:hypothetical protein